jgi:LPXTG-motif cell wall-anchored protein
VQASQTEGSGDAGSGNTGGASDTGATAAQDQGPTLPNSGADAGALLILGGLMLLLGIAVRRRAAERG